MNFIFDIGNVLINFKPIVFLETLFNEQIVIDKLNKTIFMSPEWLKLDQGVITPQEAQEIFYIREPNYRAEIQLTMSKLKDMLTPIPETIKLLPQIKNLGHKLYYLSNYHKELSRYIFNEYSFFSLFDGGVFSCDIHVIKPSSEIYRHLLQKYKLSPKDSLFFDDMEQNIVAAQKEGINGILFTDAKCVKPFLL